MFLKLSILVTFVNVSPVDAETQTPLIDVSNRVVTFTNDDSLMAPINATSDETGVLYIELPMGAYTISDDTDENYVLFSHFELESEDVAFDGDYAVSTWVNGSVRTHLDASNYADISTRSANSETFCGSAIRLGKTSLESAFMQRKIHCDG